MSNMNLSLNLIIYYIYEYKSLITLKITNYSFFLRVIILFKHFLFAHVYKLYN